MNESTGRALAKQIMWMSICFLAGALIVYGGLWMSRNVFTPDPTTNSFKTRLGVDNGTNPVAYHLPWRDGNTLVYRTQDLEDVRAAIDGQITTAQNQVMILSGTGNTGLPMVVTYRGLSSIKSKVSEVVRAGEIIGTFGANSTPRAMEQEVLKVEVTIGNKPLPPPEGLRQWPYR